MAVEYLLDALAKAERAKTQIDNLNNEVVAYLEARPYEIVTDIDPKDGRQVWRFLIPGDPPRLLAVMVGEILHNLRSALDQMACDLALKHRGSTSGVYFPFGADLSIFQKQLIEKGKKLSPEARDMIAALKPYKGGKNLLWSIHDLNRRDKHVEVVTIRLATGMSMGSLKVFLGPRLLTVGSRKGHHMLYDPIEGGLVAPTDEARGTLIEDAGKRRVHFSDFGAHDDFEFMTSEPGMILQGDFKPTFSIAIADMKEFECEPVVETLTRMRDLVEDILISFKDRFF